jgi:O-antigen ligase
MFYSKKIDCKYFFLHKFAPILIILLPVALISGPFLSDLFISLVSLIFIIRICLEKKFFYIKNIYSYFFLLFFLFLLFNSLVNFIEIKLLKNPIFYFRFGLFFLAMFYYLDTIENLAKKIFYSFLVVFSFLIIDGYLQFFSGFNMFGYQLYDMEGGARVSSFFGHELIMGSYLSRLSPLVFGLYILNKNYNKFFSFFIFALFVLIEGLVFLSGERTSFFIINFSTLICLLLLKDFKKMRLSIFITSIMLVLMISFYKPTSVQRMIYQTLTQIGYLDSAKIFAKYYNSRTNKNLNKDLEEDIKIQIDKEQYIFSKSHQSLYFTAINMFKKNIFFGIGPNNFRYLCEKKEFKHSEDSCSTHPHNFYLQFLSELGLFGFAFIIFIFFVLIYHLVRCFIGKFNKKYIFTDFEICCLSIMFVNLWPISPSGNFFNNWLSIVCYFPLGFFIWSRSKKYRNLN